MCRGRSGYVGFKGTSSHDNKALGLRFSSGAGMRGLGSEDLRSLGFPVQGLRLGLKGSGVNPKA